MIEKGAGILLTFPDSAPREKVRRKINKNNMEISADFCIIFYLL
jgi:hypothetical protein